MFPPGVATAPGRGVTGLAEHLRGTRVTHCWAEPSRAYQRLSMSKKAKQGRVEDYTSTNKKTNKNLCALLACRLLCLEKVLVSALRMHAKGQNLTGVGANGSSVYCLFDQSL
jgi:hypothetical protein